MIQPSALHQYPPPPPSLLIRLTKLALIGLLILCLGILFCGYLPSPLSQFFSGQLLRSQWHQRLSTHSANEQSASIPVYLLEKHGRMKFVVPVYTVVSTTHGRFTINWGKTFGYEIITPRPALLPDAWNFPEYPYPAPITATEVVPPLPVIEKTRQTNTSWCVIGWDSQTAFLAQDPNDTLLTKLWNKFFHNNSTAIHVDIIEGTFPQTKTPVLYLTDAEYITLSNYIHNSLSKDSSGLPRPLFMPGEGDLDSFFQAREAATLLTNGNTWVGQGLRVIQAPAPVWSPFAYFLTWHQPN